MHNAVTSPSLIHPHIINTKLDFQNEILHYFGFTADLVLCKAKEYSTCTEQ